MEKHRKFRTFWKRFQRDERGNVSLLVAAAMVGLLGMLALVADVGMLYVQKQRLYAALDSGALAGIQRILFGQQDASDTAQQYVQANGEQADSISVDTNALKIDLTGSKTVPLTFAKVLGYKSTTLNASVEAQAGTTVTATGIVPIAVPSQSFYFGQTYNLSEGAGSGLQGNYGFLDFGSLPDSTGSNGASELGSLITSGYDGKLYVGEQVDTKPGQNHGPVADAINQRISEDAGTPSCNSYQTATSGCHRLMYLPVVDTLNVDGKKPVTIVGFAAFYLDGFVYSSSKEKGNSTDYIQGTFIRTIMPGQMGNGTDYGVYSVKLTH